MRYRGSSFSHAFRRSLRKGHAAPVNCLIAAVLFAILTLGICMAVPMFLPEVRGVIPSFWSEGTFGLCYIYASFSSFALMIWHIFSLRLFSYEEIRNGKWGFSSSCGGHLGTRMAAKYCAQLFAPMFTYCLGAAAVFGSCLVLFPSDPERRAPLLCLATGALLLLCVIACESFLAGVGVQGVVLGILMVFLVGSVAIVMLFVGFLSYGS